jgi:transposase
MDEALLQENSKLKSENLDLNSLVGKLKDRVESLESILVTMKREKFGRKSERIVDDGSGQKSLFEVLNEEDKSFFNEAEVIDSANVKEKEEIEVKGYKRKKTKKTPLSELPIDEERTIDLPDEEKICSEHGKPLQLVGEKSVIKIEIIPHSRKVIKEVTPVYGPCNDFCGQEEKTQNSFDILPGTAATPSLLAELLVAKYNNALPFYRIEKIWDRIGIDFTRATMARWTILTAEQLRPLINIMIDDLMIQGYFQCDETHVNVLKLNGKRFESKSYIWTRYSPVVPIVVYEFHPTRSGDVPRAFLEDYSGFMQVDGYQGYNVISEFKNATHLCCWQHARKHFYKSYKDEQSSLAYQVLKIIKRLFKVDEETSEKKLDYEQRKILRNEKSKPILDELKLWLDSHQPEVRPSSYLGQAIEYTLNRWEKLNVFLSDGRLELSTNLVENKQRPFVIGRKNWLFFDTDIGAEAGCIHYSLIETAKSNGRDPQKYLENLFRELPKAKTIEDLEKLLPYDRKLLVEKFELSNDIKIIEPNVSK